MPSVKIRTAGRDYPEFGIKKGQQHYVWSFFKQPTQRSLTYPSRVQLTQDEAKQMLWGLYDDELPTDAAGISDMADSVREVASMLQEKLDSIPENLQGGERYQAIESSIGAVEAAADELEGLAVFLADPGEGDEPLAEADINQRIAGTEPELEY